MIKIVDKCSSSPGNYILSQDTHLVVPRVANTFTLFEDINPSLVKMQDNRMTKQENS